MNKKQFKEPIALKGIKFLFPILEKSLPFLAYNFAYWLFFRPFKYKMPEREKEAYKSAHQFQITLGQKKIQCYSWGEGPVVLFSHGWSGRATQFYQFIKPYTQQGFKVVGFDGPAHGLSEGNRTNIFEFKEVIFALKERFGKIEAMVNHSFGGMAAFFALQNGLDVKKVVNISSPSNSNVLLREFVNRINGSEKVDDDFHRRIHREFGVYFYEFSTQLIGPLLPELNLFIVHDEEDREVQVNQAKELKSIMRSAELLVTSGLGHTRILRDDDVVAKTLNFISEKESVAIST